MLAAFCQVVQKLIDWGTDVNQRRFDTDVSTLVFKRRRADLQKQKTLFEHLLVAPAGSLDR